MADLDSTPQNQVKTYRRPLQRLTILVVLSAVALAILWPVPRVYTEHIVEPIEVGAWSAAFAQLGMERHNDRLINLHGFHRVQRTVWPWWRCSQCGSGYVTVAPLRSIDLITHEHLSADRTGWGLSHLMSYGTSVDTMPAGASIAISVLGK